MLLHADFYVVKCLFSYYEINLTRYKYFEAVVKKFTSKMKEQDKTYVVTWINYKENNKWNIHLKADVIKMLRIRPFYKMQKDTTFVTLKYRQRIIIKDLITY